MDKSNLLSNKFTVNVYIEDVDAMGCVYHPNYLKFCERARTELLHGNGFCHAEHIKYHHHFFVIRHLNISYLSPAFLKDILTIKTDLIELKAASVTFEQEIYRDEKMIGHLVAKLVYVDNTFRAQKIPVNLRVLFQKFLVNNSAQFEQD